MTPGTATYPRCPTCAQTHGIYQPCSLAPPAPFVPWGFFWFFPLSAATKPLKEAGTP